MLLQACGDLINRLEKFATQINYTLADEAEKVRLYALSNNGSCFILVCIRYVV